MLSLFPRLLDFSFFATGLLRVWLALAILILGIQIIKSRDLDNTRPYWPIGVISILSGILVLIGMFTQGAVLVILLILFWLIYIKKEGSFNNDLSNKKYLGSLFVISLAILCLGAGAFAFDLMI
jgi:uncharacterized membrane protein YphA (DoxX/SURF4 family)